MVKGRSHLSRTLNMPMQSNFRRRSVSVSFASSSSKSLRTFLFAASLFLLVLSSSSLIFCSLNFSQTFSIVPVSNTVQSSCDSAHRFTIDGLVSVATTVPKYSPNLLATSPSPDPISKYTPFSDKKFVLSPSPSSIRRFPTKVHACSRLNTNIFPRPMMAFASVNDFPSLSRSRVHARDRRALTNCGRLDDLKRNSFVSKSRESCVNFVFIVVFHKSSSSYLLSLYP